MTITLHILDGRVGQYGFMCMGGSVPSANLTSYFFLYTLHRSLTTWSYHHSFDYPKELLLFGLFTRIFYQEAVLYLKMCFAQISLLFHISASISGSVYNSLNSLLFSIHHFQRLIQKKKKNAKAYQVWIRKQSQGNDALNSICISGTTSGLKHSGWYNSTEQSNTQLTLCVVPSTINILNNYTSG